MAGYSNDYLTAKSNVDIAKKTMETTADMYKSGLGFRTRPAYGTGGI
jgi:hypothetical protein